MSQTSGFIQQIVEDPTQQQRKKLVLNIINAISGLTIIILKQIPLGYQESASLVSSSLKSQLFHEQQNKYISKV